MNSVLWNWFGNGGLSGSRQLQYGNGRHLAQRTNFVCIVHRMSVKSRMQAGISKPWLYCTVPFYPTPNITHPLPAVLFCATAYANAQSNPLQASPKQPLKPRPKLTFSCPVHNCLVLYNIHTFITTAPDRSTHPHLTNQPTKPTGTDLPAPSSKSHTTPQGPS
jgi:hypothetical protein